MAYEEGEAAGQGGGAGALAARGGAAVGAELLVDVIGWLAGCVWYFCADRRHGSNRRGGMGGEGGGIVPSYVGRPCLQVPSPRAFRYRPEEDNPSAPPRLGRYDDYYS